ncbi:hypothetical protein ACG3SL_12375 [Sphingomonas sp. CJ20]
MRVARFSYAPAPNDANGQATDNRYRRLFQVEITHNFYTQNAGRCSDFHVMPTDATAKLMATLGLAMNNERAGFSVFFRPDRKAAIRTYLEQEADREGTPRSFWTRLTFLLVLENPAFVGITALPIGMRQSDQNLYGCNQEAHYPISAPHGMTDYAILSADRFLSADALRPTVSDAVDLTVPWETKSIIVEDISGATVLYWPTPEQAAQDAAQEAAKRADAAAENSPEPLPSAKSVPLDFSGLPHDLYTILAFGPDDRVTPILTREVLYVPVRTDALVLLDMLLTQPTEDTIGGVYPVPSLFDPANKNAEWGDVFYRLPFDARQTYWRYYVVSQIPGGSFSDLSIDGPDATFQQQPNRVPLPDGSLATLFTTDTALPLRQKSPQRFALQGLRSDPRGGENMIRLAPLPVAPPAPVWPADADQPTYGTSEMFLYV